MNIVPIPGERQEVREPAPLIVSSSEFIAGFIPPDYLIDGILQRRFIYSLTAPTGGGKTAIALLFTAHVQLGWQLDGRDVARGAVLYFAGENPDDVRMRWMAMAQEMHFDIDEAEVYFIPGKYKIPDIIERVTQEAKRLVGIAFVVIDTSAAYYDGRDENDNVEMGTHGRMLRTLTTIPGEPTVLVCCHPTKHASNDNLLPRGGGAFIAEMDGNLVCQKRDTVVDLHWQGKFRGPDFEPIGFQLATVTCDALHDSKGRTIPTVMAKPMTDRARGDIEAAARSDQDTILLMLQQTPGASISGMAEVLQWFTGKDKSKPHKSRVYRALAKLKADKLAAIERDHWQLTEKGKKEAERVKGNIEMAGAKYG